MHTVLSGVDRTKGLSPFKSLGKIVNHKSRVSEDWGTEEVCTTEDHSLGSTQVWSDYRTIIARTKEDKASATGAGFTKRRPREGVNGEE